GFNSRRALFWRESEKPRWRGLSLSTGRGRWRMAGRRPSNGCDLHETATGAIRLQGDGFKWGRDLDGCSNGGALYDSTKSLPDVVVPHAVEPHRCRAGVVRDLFTIQIDFARSQIASRGACRRTDSDRA